MKEVKMERWSIKEANERIGKSFGEKYWRFLISRILSYPEITISPNGDILAPSYIPLRDVIREVVNEIEIGVVNVETCEVCAGYFDIDCEDGIFGDPSGLKRFICKSCSSGLSAKEFYDNYLLLK